VCANSKINNDAGLCAYELICGVVRANFVVFCLLWHPDSESKLESVQHKHMDSLPSKKFQTQPSVGCVLATVFWDLGRLESPQSTRTAHCAQLLAVLRQPRPLPTVASRHAQPTAAKAPI